MRRRLLDTDTMSFILNKRFGVADKARDYIREHGPVAISTITCYEILRGLYYAGATSKLAAFERFIATNVILPFDLPASRKQPRFMPFYAEMVDYWRMPTSSSAASQRPTTVCW